MGLDIIVCIKQVPDPQHFSRITLDPVRQTIQRAGIPTITNPLDRHALEEGLRIREKVSGKVTAVTMGPPEAREVLEEALAMGVDQVFLLCDRAFAGADSLATASCLAKSIQRLDHYDLVLCGNETVDGGTSQVGPQLAEFLGIPHVTYVNEVQLSDDGSLMVKRALEHGYMKVRVQLPALLSVTKEINRFRLPSALAIMQALRKEVPSWGCEEVGGSVACYGLHGSPTQVIGAFEHKQKREGEILQGTPEEVARKAVRKLRGLGVL